MIKQEDTEQPFVSSRPSLIDFNSLTRPPKDQRKLVIKAEPQESNTSKKRKVDPSAPSLFAYSVAEFDECDKCEKARSAGLDAWMDHLGHFHTFPTRWPSSRIQDGSLNQEHPYTSAVDSHIKRKSGAIPRPLNSFMVFLQYIRRLTRPSFPDVPNVHISRQVGRLWRNLPNDYREIYATESRRLQALHSLEFPDYKYQPRRRLRSKEYELTSSQTPSSRHPLPRPLPPPPPPPPLSSAPHIPNQRQYFEQYPENTNAKYSPKTSSSSLQPKMLDSSSGVSDFTSCFLNFPPLSGCSSNTDTLLSLQGVDSHRELQQQDELNFYQPPPSYASTSDRLSWTEEKIMELLGPPPLFSAPTITSSSDDLLSPCDNWYQYQREGTFSEPPLFPGIETWTFSGPTI